MAEATVGRLSVGTVLVRIAGALVIAGVALMLFAPPTSLGVDTGALGATLMPVGVVLGLAALGMTRPREGSLASFGEKMAMLSVLVTLAAGAYLVIKLTQLGWDVSYPNRSLHKVTTNVVTILIAGGIAAQVLRRREGGTLLDERDRDVSRRAASVAHVVLVVLLAVFAVSLGIPGVRWLPLSTPSGIAHGLILAIGLSELVRHATATWIYRKDRS